MNKKTNNEQDNNTEDLKYLRIDYVSAIRKLITRFTNEIHNEMDDDTPIISGEDKRFERLTRMLSDAPKTLETFEKILGEGSVMKENTSVVKGRNGKKIGIEENLGEIVGV